MSYNAYSNTSLTTLNQETFRNGSHCYPMRFVGLRPNTKHKMYLDGEDYTWACKGWGQNLGEDIVSNENGVAVVYVLYEIPFSQPVAYEGRNVQSIAYYSERINNKNKRMEDIVTVQWKTFEIRSGDSQSYAAVQMHFHICRIKGDYNHITQHD